MSGIDIKWLLWIHNHVISCWVNYIQRCIKPPFLRARPLYIFMLDTKQCFNRIKMIHSDSVRHLQQSFQNASHYKSLKSQKKSFKTISREVKIKTRLLIAGIMNLYLGFVLSYLNTVCIAETFCLSLSKTSHGLYVSAVQVF